MPWGTHTTPPSSYIDGGEEAAFKHFKKSCHCLPETTTTTITATLQQGQASRSSLTFQKPPPPGLFQETNPGYG